MSFLTGPYRANLRYWIYLCQAFMFSCLCSADPIPVVPVWLLSWIPWNRREEASLLFSGICLWPGGRRRLYCFRVFVCDRVIMTVWRHIATTQTFASLDQFSVEKPSKLNKERANTGFCSALVKQFVVSVQALLLILFVCKSCVCFVRTFVLNSTPIHFGSVAWAPFWTRN